MRTLVISHNPSEAPGRVGERLVARGAELEVFVVCEDPARPVSHRRFPPPDGFDLVVVMGAPWSLCDRDTIGTWIDRELDLLRGCVAADVAVLGICFGAQALAAVTGGRVEPAPRPELGWGQVASRVAAIAEGPWFQWHQDRFAPPPDAEVLATNAAGPQAFRIGRHLGVQFHPEVDTALLADWLGGEVTDALFERLGVDPAEVLTASADAAHQAAPHTARLVDWFLDEVAHPGAAPRDDPASPTPRRVP